jgi:hypothetical protein
MVELLLLLIGYLIAFVSHLTDTFNIHLIRLIYHLTDTL